MKIGEVARKAGVRPSAIRFYERVGVLPQAYREGSQRRFTPDIERFLAIIQVARQAGLTVAEIKLLFHGFRLGTPASVRWRHLARKKLTEIERQIARLNGMKRLLKQGMRCHCIRLEDCGRVVMLRSGRKDS